MDYYITLVYNSLTAENTQQNLEQEEKESMKYFTTPLFGLVALTIFGGVALTTVSQAREMPMKGRYVNLKGESNCTTIDDVKGHVICTFEQPSVGLNDDGDFFSRSIKGTLDHVKGEGKIQGYLINTYMDGSSMTTEWKGISKFNDKKVRITEGSYRCIAGSGRFASVKCDGTWTASAQKGGFTLGEYGGTMTLPE